MKIITIKNPQTKDKNPNLIQQAGFTLIELSIVLVIIGLIVGGVLVGQDLIKAAEIRSTISQYEKYNAAMNTFRTKYNGMPGDLAISQAGAFGLFTLSATVTNGLGDGNGLIESSSTNLNVPFGETAVIWRHLSDASLIDGSYGAGTVITAATGVITTTAPATYLPPAKLGRGNYWIAGSTAGQNYYGLVNPSALIAGAVGTAAYTIAAGGGLTPTEAFNIDSKLDDGMPLTGIVQARGGVASTNAVDATFAGTSAKWTTATPASAAAGDCVTTGASGSDTANTYARGATPGNSPACTMRLRFN